MHFFKHSFIFLAFVVGMSILHAEDASSSPLAEALAGNTLVLNEKGDLVASELRQDLDYYVLYFSAHWCPPCRQFTPKLSAFYNKNHNEKSKYDIIFVSSDRNADAMHEYMRWGDMQWKAVRYDKIPELDAVTRYAGEGLPWLVVVDRDGSALASTQLKGPYADMSDVLAKLAQISK